MLLEVNNVTKSFCDPKRGDVTAVDSVAFSCDGGEIFGLLGPNGAGKTTTLRLVSSLLAPDSGTISVCGFDSVKSPLELRKRIGFLSSDTGLYARLTPRETLKYFAQLCQYPAEKIDERIEYLISKFEMQSFANTYCEKLSTGMKQRASIARAIVHEPPLVILDEPTNGLDIFGILAMHEVIMALKAESRCVVVSTHVMSEAEKLCDRVGIIHRGKLFATGTLEELRAKTDKHYLEDIFVSLVKETSGGFA